MAPPERPRFDVTTFGETMLRLGVPVGQRLEEAASLELHVGGAESNLCAALAALGHTCGWAGRLPASPLGRLVVRRLRAAGVDTSAVVLVPGARIGVYYLEAAVPPRSPTVVYDRAHSAAATTGPDDLDWSYLLDTRIVHLTGITPALSASCREVTAEALRRAKASGVSVSFDVNHRGKLWEPAQAREALDDVVRAADLLFCSHRDARAVFGTRSDPEQALTDLANLSGAGTIVMSRGADGVSALQEGRRYHQPAVPVDIVDRPGAGDALAAGVLSGVLSGSLSAGLRLGSSLAALALSQRGDMVVTDLDEVEAALADGTGAIER